MIGLALLRQYWPAIGAAVLLVALLAGARVSGIRSGTTSTTAHYEALLAERDRVAAAGMAKALQDSQAQAQAAMQAERSHLQTQAKADEQFKVITRTVTKYVATHPAVASCGLDPLGLRLWNDANRGASTGPPDHP